jgi:hypothetical protein
MNKNKLIANSATVGRLIQLPRDPNNIYPDTSNFPSHYPSDVFWFLLLEEPIESVLNIETNSAMYQEH